MTREISFEKLIEKVGIEEAFNQVTEYLEKQGLKLTDLKVKYDPPVGQQRLVLSEN